MKMMPIEGENPKAGKAVSHLQEQWGGICVACPHVWQGTGDAATSLLRVCHLRWQKDAAQINKRFTNIIYQGALSQDD